MASYKDRIPTQQGWIHELARGEIHPDADQILQLGKNFDPQQMVEESTVGFLTDLRERLTEYLKIFNAYGESGAKFQEVKLYSIAQTAADFMLFRNSIKLVVSNSAHGMIQISFAQHIRGTLSVDGQMHGGVVPQGQVHELIAQLGPFRDIAWTFQGEKVSSEQVAKFYFTEFVRMTRDTKRSRAGNQVLLDQIKALLQEKGLDL